MKPLVFVAIAIALLACAPAPDDCKPAAAHVVQCGGRDMPACDPCQAACYVAATCIEITGRLNWPQPGEADGGTLYSNLDVCLAECAG
jgi:hypothetical protein